MQTKRAIRVTLSDELLDHLRAEARRRKVPLKWLVAGLICDTIEPAEARREKGSLPPARQVA
jgi:hypothetical protein